MTLELQNINDAKRKLDLCDVSTFVNSGSSFKFFIYKLKVNLFRHINNLEITFDHPVTVISGTNKVGKTSLLLLLACSHEKFLKLDSTSPTPYLREHVWNDVISFTDHENESNDYSYELGWRVGTENRSGTGKRLARSRAWSGLGKRSSNTSRINAKIRDREVRLIDLERILPSRSFSGALFRKANEAPKVRLNEDIEKAFAYIFQLESVKIFETGSHINKTCFLISKQEQQYSSFGAASGEEAIIYLLKDLINSPKNSLLLIDEIEAGFHPSIQRRIASIVLYLSWRDKKQFIITTHSPTLLSAFPSRSRRFIEKTNGIYKVVPKISYQSASSKMDSVGYPLVRLYCEDELAAYIISKTLQEINQSDPNYDRLFNIIQSGPADQVLNDYVRHKRNFRQFKNKIGYCAIFDGDYKDNPQYSHYHNSGNEFTLFMQPFLAPEKFLVGHFLIANPNESLASNLQHENHHDLFDRMVELGLASDKGDARNQCYAAFKASGDFQEHKRTLVDFFEKVVEHFSALPD